MKCPLKANKKEQLKKLLFGLIFCVGNLFAQEYKPLLGDVNEWQLTYCHSGCLTDVYYTDGDTIVDGMSFKILDGYHYISRTFLLREDIAERQVHIKIILPNRIENHLLYDFSLEVGDSIKMNNPVTPFPADGGYFLLDSIVNKTIANDEAHRHFYFSPTSANEISFHNVVWIEGVGSLSLINAPGGEAVINQVGQLSCAFKETGLVYSNLEYIDSCEPFYLTTPELTNSLEQALVYTPNFQKKIVIENAEEVNFIKVYDLKGSQVANSFHLASSRIEMDLSTVSSGIYLLKMSSKSGKHKIVKVRLN